MMKILHVVVFVVATMAVIAIRGNTILSRFKRNVDPNCCATNGGKGCKGRMFKILLILWQSRISVVVLFWLKFLPKVIIKKLLDKKHRFWKIIIFDFLLQNWLTYVQILCKQFKTLRYSHKPKKHKRSQSHFSWITSLKKYWPQVECNGLAKIRVRVSKCASGFGFRKDLVFFSKILIL